MQASITVPALLRIEAARALTGDTRSTFYFKAAQGLMTRPIKIGPRAAAVPANEIAAINAARIRGAGDDEIKALVTTLHAQRAGCAA
jgi:prophage regulatory protein